MLTFDNLLQDPFSTLKELADSKIPDLHEVGENDLCWVYCRRSTRKLEIVSKHSGNLIAKCDLADAANYGISLAQIECAKGVLKL